LSINFYKKRGHDKEFQGNIVGGRKEKKRKNQLAVSKIEEEDYDLFL
jgi:hypothetical protein